MSIVALCLVGGACVPVHALAQSCRVPAEHAGLTFPVEHIDPSWSCRLETIITNYTTANKVGPVRTPLPEHLYRYFLEHPSVAAALVNRLDIGPYKVEERGPGRYWATDGEGTSGLAHLVHHDRLTRVYYLEGTHDGPWLPSLSASAVVLLRITPLQDEEGTAATDTTVVSYLRVNNRIVSGLLSLLRPLIGQIVTGRLLKAFDAAGRLALVMRDTPDRVLFEASDPPSLPDDAIAFLQGALPALHNRADSTRIPTTTP